MEWYEKMEKCLFVNDFSQYLLNFLADRAEITGQSNSEKWNLFFEKVEGWMNQFFISSEPVELYGSGIQPLPAPGWYRISDGGICGGPAARRLSDFP